MPGLTAVVREHVETVMEVLVGGEMESVATTVHDDRECKMRGCCE